MIIDRSSGVYISKHYTGGERAACTIGARASLLAMAPFSWDSVPSLMFSIECGSGNVPSSNLGPLLLSYSTPSSGPIDESQGEPMPPTEADAGGVKVMAPTAHSSLVVPESPGLLAGRRTQLSEMMDLSLVKSRRHGLSYCVFATHRPFTTCRNRCAYL